MLPAQDKADGVRVSNLDLFISVACGKNIALILNRGFSSVAPPSASRQYRYAEYTSLKTGLRINARLASAARSTKLL